MEITDSMQFVERSVRASVGGTPSQACGVGQDTDDARISRLALQVEAVGGLATSGRACAGEAAARALQRTNPLGEKLIKTVTHP